MGWYAKKDGKRPRGFLVASDFPAPVQYAAEAIPGLTLIAYKVQFAFSKVGID
jgi:hypothetical protein